ncbi:MAG: ATP-binding protein, partial [Myxococcaceae bacterium]|nr:ATP-binding protein [Myxococcaceae bacterium]
RLRAVAGLVVPDMVDGCIFDLVQPDGSLSRVVSVHAGTAALKQMGRLRRRSPLQWDGRSLTLPKPAEKTAGLLVVPLSARGRTIGAMSLFLLTSGSRCFDAATRALAEDLALRVANAVDNRLLVDEARAAVRLRDDFLVVAAHELKTPLTALDLQLAHMGRLLGKKDLSPALFNEKLDKVRRHLGRLASLVEELLDVSRIASGRLVLHLERVDLGKLGKEVAGRFSEQASARGSELALTAEGNLEGNWDAFRLDQVLTNLVSNAIKYGLGRPISVLLEGTDGTVRVLVRDQGIGIAPEDVGRIFSRFERAVPSKHYGGLGLGLFITQQIVEVLGGSIAVESEVGNGSTFIVTLPRAGPAVAVGRGAGRPAAGPLPGLSPTEAPV